jgi:uncharacterized membrane protein HdeD (DUF308 family)
MTVFVSYSSRDKDAVKSLTQDLQDADEQVWLDQRLAGGDAWWRAILEQIRGCDVFVFALSQNSIQSKPCQAELHYAQALGLPILPVQVGPVDSMQLNPLATVQTVDYRSPTPGTAMRLLAALHRAHLQRQPLPADLPDEPPVPFEYLIRLYTTIAGPDYLSPPEQAALLAQLQFGLREDGEHDAARNDIVMLLRKMRDREDVTYRTRTEVDGILASVDAGPRTQPPIVTDIAAHAEGQPDSTTLSVSTGPPPAAPTSPPASAPDSAPQPAGVARFSSDARLGTPDAPPAPPQQVPPAYAAWTPQGPPPPVRTAVKTPPTGRSSAPTIVGATLIGLAFILATLTVVLPYARWGDIDVDTPALAAHAKWVSYLVFVAAPLSTAGVLALLRSPRNAYWAVLIAGLCGFLQYPFLKYVFTRYTYDDDYNLGYNWNLWFPVFVVVVTAVCVLIARLIVRSEPIDISPAPRLWMAPLISGALAVIIGVVELAHIGRLGFLLLAVYLLATGIAQAVFAFAMPRGSFARALMLLSGVASVIFVVPAVFSDEYSTVPVLIALAFLLRGIAVSVAAVSYSNMPARQWYISLGALSGIAAILLRALAMTLSKVIFAIGGCLLVTGIAEIMLAIQTRKAASLSQAQSQPPVTTGG